MINQIRSIIKKQILIIRRLAKRNKLFLSLNSNTVFINSASWNLFDVNIFLPVVGYQLVHGNIDLVRKKDYQKIIAYIGNVEKNKLIKMNNLRWLQLASHGYNGFDNRSLYASDSVTVSNLKNVFAGPISDFCIAAYYYFYNYSFRSISNRPMKVTEIPQKPSTVNVLIIGIGNIGTAIAKKCKNNGWNVFGVKKNIDGYLKPDYVDSVSSLDQVDELLRNSDYVINVLPDSEDTRHIYDYDFFKKMKKTALFCNVGRGSAVVDEDIEKAVDEGVIAGAVLDASSKKHYKAKNIIVTNHTSSVGPNNAEAYDIYYTGQLKKFLNGETLDNIIPLK